jgi:hypothetical protein
MTKLKLSGIDTGKSFDHNVVAEDVFLLSVGAPGYVICLIGWSNVMLIAASPLAIQEVGSNVGKTFCTFGLYWYI